MEKAGGGPIEPQDEIFMREAIDEALRAYEAGEVPVGAIVVCEGRIVGRGFNRPISTHDPTAHAEIVALREAAARLNNYRLIGCALYVTLEPCAMCAGAVVLARLDRLVFGAADPKSGACGSLMNIVQDSRLNHRTFTTRGVREAECGALLKAFFERLRGQ